jgi:antitoxin component YwqK of YwqJK toxin-antitoxin module
MSTAADLNVAEVPYQSGAIRYRYARILSEDGTRWVRHGLFVEYLENGNVLSEGTYVYGHEHGPWRDYHANGQVAAEGSYEHGQEHGVWRHWSETGSEEPSVTYVKGEERA